MCTAHPYTGVKVAPMQTHIDFLERCCEIGLLERQSPLENRIWSTVRYCPTRALDEWASWLEEN